MHFNNSTDLLKISVTKQIACNIHYITLIPCNSFDTPTGIDKFALRFEKFATHYNTIHNSFDVFIWHVAWRFLNVATPVLRKIYGFDICRFAMQYFYGVYYVSSSNLIDRLRNPRELLSCFRLRCSRISKFLGISSDKIS